MEEATWMTSLLTLWSPKGEIWGWSRDWRFWSGRGLNLVVVPRLYLTQTPVFGLTHARPVPDVLKECSFQAPSLNYVKFMPLTGTFPLYRNGRSELWEVSAILETSGPSETLPKLGEILHIARDLLT